MNKNKCHLIMLIGASFLMLTIGSVLFKQMYTNYQANERTIENCFERFDEADSIVLQKNQNGSITCDKK